MSMTTMSPTFFAGEDERYTADTCESLKSASAVGELQLVARSRGHYPGPPLPKGILQGVRSIGCWNAENDQTWGLDWHRNEGIELTYVARGRVMFGVDDKQIELKSGDLVITRPWQLHRLGAPMVTASCVHWLILDAGVRRPNQDWTWPTWLILSDRDRMSLTKMLSQNEQPVWQADATIDQYFSLLSEAIDPTVDEPSESHIKLYINGLWIGVTDLLRGQQPILDANLSSSLRTVELFLKSIREFPGKEWNLENMAAACGLRRSRFTHYCKQITNLSPNEFLSQCRIKYASQILVERRHLSVTDVAFESGFSSSQYFATVFQRQVGCSPSVYRRVHANVD